MFLQRIEVYDMKTIEIISGAQKAQFTTKSVTLDGREYLYINMSDVRNDKLNRVYTFVYDSEVKAVPYEKKDAKTLAVIFGQVRAMEEKRRAHQAAAAHPEGHASADTGAAQQASAYTPDVHAQNTAVYPQTQNGASAPQYAAPEMPQEGTPQYTDAQQPAHDGTFAPQQYAAPEMPLNAHTTAAEQMTSTEETDPKAARKAEKERLKAERKAEKERLKAEKKAAKERAKAEKEALKAGAASPAVTPDTPVSGEAGAVQQFTETVPAEMPGAATETAPAETPVTMAEAAEISPETAAETAEVSPEASAADATAADPENTIVFTGSAPSSEAIASDSIADADSTADPEPADDAKKKKLKKSFITFGIVIAAIAVIAVIFFLFFGTSKDPSPVNPSSTDSNTYQDVDELINDLQN